MKNTVTIHPSANAFALHANGAPMLTPAKKPMALPTQALAAAIAHEWDGAEKYSLSKMPLTSLAYTAIDRIADQRAAIVEVLLVYVDTDTLSYRASGSEALAKRQQLQWDPIVDWASKKLGAEMQVTSGVMPVDQPPELHKAIETYLNSLTDLQHAALCILSSGFSSLVLAIAVVDARVTCDTGFTISRLEEEFQAEQWGRDAEADVRTARLKSEIMEAGRFLDLLQAP